MARQLWSQMDGRGHGATRKQVPLCGQKVVRSESHREKGSVVSRRAALLTGSLGEEKTKKIACKSRGTSYWREKESKFEVNYKGSKINSLQSR